MFKNFRERSPRHRINYERLPPRSGEISNELHFTLLNKMNTLEEWKNYSEVYPHLTADDYFWKKLMVKFPDLTVKNYQAIHWADALDYVDFKFTLVYAYETDNAKLAKQVLDYGGNVYQMYDNTFLFFIIMRHGKFDMARVFLDKGFDINTVDNDQNALLYWQTALMHCVEFNNIESVKFLLERGADVNIVLDTYWFSALTTFCINYPSLQNDAMLRVLTDYGADYNLKNKNNEVALHFLIRGLYSCPFSSQIANVHVKRMFTLFVHYTDTTVITTKNQTLLHALCTSYGNVVRRETTVDLYIFIIATFLSAGIPINAVDDEGNTALDHAIYHDFDAIRAFLRMNGGLSRTEL